MAKKLKNVLVNSVDLCKQGANQRAFICLKKSMEGKENMSDLKTSIIQNVCKELNITDNYEEYIDLFDSTLSVEEQRQKIRNIYQKKSLSACAHCQGMCDDSQRFPPAQQLTKQELLCIKAGAKTLFDVREMLEENEEVS